MKDLNFILVDDNEIFRETLKKFLADEFSSKVIAEVNRSEELLTLDNIHVADIIFINLVIPGANEFEIVKRILWNYPLLKVIGITYYTDAIYLLQLIEAGFKGGLDKNKIFDEVADAVGMVMGGNYYFSSSILKNCKCDYKQ